MLISHEYQFIFIKTRKTAGTSLEISLSRFLGPLDVITPISPRDEIERARMGIIPRNYLNCVHFLPSSHDLSEEEMTGMLASEEMQRRFYNHCSARQIKASVGDRIWSSYLKFCFDRNPWERVVSEYHFVKKTQPERFAEFRLKDFVEQEMYIPNASLYMIDGEPAVNFLGRYENLLTDLTTICQQLNLPFDGWLPEAKSHLRPARDSAEEQLTPHLMNLIARQGQAEIELFDYRPPMAA